MTPYRLRIRGLLGFAAAATLLTGMTLAAPEEKLVTGTGPSFVWPSEPPADCPFPKSAEFTGLQFTGRYATCGGDGWRLSWDSDDRLYANWTDGPSVNGVKVGGGIGVKQPSLGFCVFEGGDPLALKVSSVTVIKTDPFPYGGQYPCGLLVHDGICYYGTYALDFAKDAWDIMGPLIGFHVSKDYGRTWHADRTPKAPLFGESAKDGRPVRMWARADEYEKSPWSKSGKPGAKVKIGAAYFVDFGKNMADSPDGKAYLVAQGATRPESYNAWAAADHAYLLRVKPSPETINDPKAYEFFAGHLPDGHPVWTTDFNKIQPLVAWNDHMGTPGITYIAPLKRYFMCVSDGRGPKNTGTGPFDTYVLESEQVTGPWRLVTYLKKFGEEAYFTNILSRYMSADGRTLWLCYGANWSHRVANPSGTYHGLNLQEIRLMSPATQ